MSEKLKINPELWKEAPEGIVDVQVLDSTSRKLFDWRDNPPSAPNPSIKFDDDRDFLSQLEEFSENVFTDSILQRLLISKTFMAMLEITPDLADVPVNIAKLKKGAGASYFDQDDRATINSDQLNHYGDNVTPYTFLVAHELRHAWHKRMGVFDDTDRMTMEDIMLLNRAYEADCAAFQASFCWDFKIFGDDSHWNFLRTNSAYILSANAFEKQMEQYEIEFEEWDWCDALEDGNYAEETGAAQQKAFEGFFQKRSLKISYDNHALDTYVRHNNRRKYKINPDESRLLLEDKLQHLGLLPYLNMNGDLVDRPQYRPLRILDIEIDHKFNQVHEAGTLLRMRHVSKKRQPMNPRPPHI